MKFDDLDTKMRVFETADDYCVLPEMYMVARLDGKSFTKLTKTVHNFEAPFDVKFRDFMIGTVEHLMQTGFNVIYGFTQSDEISLLFHQNEEAFERKVRKYNSILAGEASAKFSTQLGNIACFDCRISQLPNAQLVIDYFSWRSEDANRNALNAHCYWMLRKQGLTVKKATDATHKMSIAGKTELLLKNGINFNSLPNWQKRGTGVYWETYQKTGMNPVKGKEEKATRRRLKVDAELPVKSNYHEMIRKIINM